MAQRWLAGRVCLAVVCALLVVATLQRPVRSEPQEGANRRFSGRGEGHGETVGGHGPTSSARGYAHQGADGSAAREPADAGGEPGADEARRPADEEPGAPDLEWDAAELRRRPAAAAAREAAEAQALEEEEAARAAELAMEEERDAMRRAAAAQQAVAEPTHTMGRSVSGKKCAEGARVCGDLPSANGMAMLTRAGPLSLGGM